MSILYKERLKGDVNPHWKGGKVSKICSVCGKEILIDIGQINTRHYCSYSCMGKARTKPRQERMKVGRSFAKGEFQHNCKLCGVKIPSGRFYCKICSPRGKSTITTCCEVCGKLFTHWKGLTRRFCSVKCYRTICRADGNPNWKGGKLSLSQRIRNCKKNRLLIASILKRDKYTCQKCGQVGGELEVDHIKPFSQILDEFLQQYQVLSKPTFEYELSLIALKYKPFWDRKNLRTLCKKCNWNRHINGYDDIQGQAL